MTVTVGSRKQSPLSFCFQVWEVDLTKQQEEATRKWRRGGGRLPCSESCAGIRLICTTGGFPTTTCIWPVCLAFLFHLKGYSAPTSSQPRVGAWGRMHPKADHKHPRAQSSQSLQVTVITKNNSYYGLCSPHLRGIQK